MKITDGSENMFFANDLRDISGMKSQKIFFRKIFEESVLNLKKYYKCFPKRYEEHGFLYGEEQMKTFLTPAISRVTNGFFLQECPVNRKNKNLENLEDGFTSNGRLDYWANYGDSSFLIEMKHQWIRYYAQKNKFTFYKGIEKQIESATKQLDKVLEKPTFNFGKNQFGIALVVSPVFVVNENVTPLSFDKEVKQSITKNCKNAGANIMAVWSLESEYLYLSEFETQDGKQRTNYYPALFFIGKIKKYSKG